MKIKPIPLIFFLLLLSTFKLNAQHYRSTLEGRVFSSDGDVAATHVSNISSNKGTITDKQGFFAISVKLGDELEFSGVQFKKRKITITQKLLDQDLFLVFLEPSLTLLNEVVVTPYNLSGDLNRDAKNIKIAPIITASTLGLPNAYVKVKTQNERKLFEADNGKFISFGRYSLDSLFNPTVFININKILNRVTGRTQKLKKFVAIDREIELLQKTRRIFNDSLYVKELKIPKERISDFFNFCQNDTLYTEIAKSDDALNLWDFLKRNSTEYLKNNALDEKTSNN